MSNDPAGSRYWVRSVARAAEILAVLSKVPAGGGLSVTEVARACGLAKSAAYATLYTLGEYGLVADDGAGKNRRYRLGMTLARQGDRARAQISLRDVARPVLTELTAATGLTSRLAVPDGDHAVVVDHVASEDRVQFELRMGARELPHCTALGKAILSTLTDSEAADVLRRVGLPRRTEATFTDAAALIAHLERVRSLGYAVDDEEDAAGIVCIGSALCDHAGGCAGALSVTALKGDRADHDIADLGVAVRDAARRISRLLGYSPASS